MQITCPACAAVYEVPSILLSRPRTMRCAICAQDWQTTAIDPHAAAPEAPNMGSDIGSDIGPNAGALSAEILAPEALAPGPDHAAMPRRGARVAALLHGTAPALAGWALSLGVLFIAGRASVEHRAGIIAVWPASQWLFLWLGLG